MRNKFSLSLLSGVVTATLISCGPPMSAPEPIASSRHFPMIVRLESRHYSITISAGPRGPVYSISNSTGQMLVENVSLNDLQAVHPELYNLLAPALAPSASACIGESSGIILADNR